jgi:hypothetical protein
MIRRLGIRLLLIFSLAASAFAAEPRGPFYDPVTGFSKALTPILSGFEKAKVETTLRGFIARADSFPGFDKSDLEPTEYGLYLNVAVRDADEVKGFSDHTEMKESITHRLVQITPPKGGDQAIVIALDYGPKVAPKVIRAIDKCIRGVIEFSRRTAK